MCSSKSICAVLTAKVIFKVCPDSLKGCLYEPVRLTKFLLRLLQTPKNDISKQNWLSLTYLFGSTKDFRDTTQPDSYKQPQRKTTA